MAEEQYEKWWMELLDHETRARIETAIAQFPRNEAFRAAYLKHLRPKAVFSEIGRERASFDELCEVLPHVDLDKFMTLLTRPVKRRSGYAEAFGKRVTRILKDFLEVPAHRPKVKPSKADSEDDKWLRRLAAYIWNFPEKFS